MGYKAQKCPPHNLNKKRVLFVVLLFVENCQIFFEGQCENTFEICLPRAKALGVTKIENISSTNKHSVGYCGQKSAIF